MCGAVGLSADREAKMKMNEVASAEDQLALWKLINQNVWTALEQQRIEQQRAQKASKRSINPALVLFEGCVPCAVHGAPRAMFQGRRAS